MKIFLEKIWRIITNNVSYSGCAWPEDPQMHIVDYRFCNKSKKEKK